MNYYFKYNKISGAAAEKTLFPLKTDNPVK